MERIAPGARGRPVKDLSTGLWLITLNQNGILRLEPGLPILEIMYCFRHKSPLLIPIVLLFLDLTVSGKDIPRTVNDNPSLSWISTEDVCSNFFSLYYTDEPIVIRL